MAVLQTLYGTVRSVPQTGEKPWGAEATNIVLDLMTGTDEHSTLVSGVSNFVLGSVTVSSLAAAATLTPATSIHRVSGSGGPVTLSAVTAIADGSKDGQMLLIVGTDAVNTVTINDAANTKLASNITLGLEDQILLVWDATSSHWREFSRLSSVGAGSLDAAYNVGSVIAVDVGAVQLDVSANIIGLDVNKTALGAGNAVDIDNDGTGSALNIVQDGVAVAALITQNAAASALQVVGSVGATDDVVRIQKLDAGADRALNIFDTGIGDTVEVNKTLDGKILDLNKTGLGAGDVVDINNDGTGAGILLNQDGDGVGIDVNKNGTGAGIGVDVLNAGTDFGVRISQTGVGVALSITSNVGVDVDTIQVTKSGIGTGDTLQLTNNGTGDGIHLSQIGNGRGIDINKSGLGTGNCIDIDNDGTGNCIFARQDGIGIAVNIDQNAAATALFINQATSSTGIVMTQVGDGIAVDVNKTGLGAGNAVDIDNDGTGIALNVRQDGIGIAANIDQNAAAIGLNIDQDGAGVALMVNQATASDGIDLTQVGNGIALDVNKTGAGAGNAVDIDNDGTGIGLRVQQDGIATAVQIDQNTSGIALDVDGTTGTGISVLTTTGACCVLTGQGTILSASKSASASAGNVANFDNNDDVGSALALAVINGGNAADVLEILSTGSGNYIDTDAGAGTPAHLTNAGVWTDASCWRRLKQDIEVVDEEAFLQDLMATVVARYRHRSDLRKGVKNPRRYVGVFQDDLVKRFGCGRNGVSAKEVAAIGIAGVKQVYRELAALRELVYEFTGHVPAFV